MGEVAFLNRLNQFLSYCGCLLFGLLSVSVLLIHFIFSFPFLIYRFIVVKLIAPLYHPDIGNPVSIKGHAFATELHSSNIHIPPRCSIVTCFVTEGTFSREEWLDVVRQKWIQVENEKGQLLYPEFQQYIGEFMGFMFFKKDKNFDLENHIICHEIDKSVSPADSKRFVDQLIESLLNKTYTPKRSPWEVHMVTNYRCPELQSKTKDGKMTAFILRSHHSMADGFSIFKILVEGLLNRPLSECNVAVAKAQKVERTTMELLVKCLRLPFDMIRDVGFGFSPLVKQRTPWHIPDKMKHWKQLYSRSPMIPIDKVKFIKGKLGTSFTSVILSSISAGIAESFKQKGYMGKHLPFAATLPLPGHPKQLTNHITGTLVTLPIDYSLTSLERLQRTEVSFNDAKQSHIPVLFSPVQDVLSFQIAPVARFGFTNRMIAAGCSNFPGPVGVKLHLNGRKVLTCHFSAGALIGVNGAAFMVLSFEDHIYIAANVESALVDRTEIEELIKRICNEIDKLYSIALQSDRIN